MRTAITDPISCTACHRGPALARPFLPPHRLTRTISGPVIPHAQRACRDPRADRSTI